MGLSKLHARLKIKNDELNHLLKWWVLGKVFYDSTLLGVNYFKF
jgi:hypothetical protein